MFDYVGSTGVNAYVTPAPASPAPTPAPDAGGPSVGSLVGNAVLTGMTGGMLGSNGISGISLQRVVVIIIGLLLVAAGIFAFKSVRENVIEGVKTGVKTAAVA